MLLEQAKRGQTGTPGQAKANLIVGRIERRKAAPQLPVDMIPEDGIDVTGRRLTLMDVGAHDCKWINGDPLADHTFCGKPVREGTAWCEDHHKRVYLR